MVPYPVHAVSFGPANNVRLSRSTSNRFHSPDPGWSWCLHSTRLPSPSRPPPTILIRTVLRLQITLLCTDGIDYLTFTGRRPVVFKEARLPSVACSELFPPHSGEGTFVTQRSHVVPHSDINDCILALWCSASTIMMTVRWVGVFLRIP